MSLKEDMGVRIRELREDAGWSQDDLASAIRVDRSMVGYIERGKSNTSPEVLERLAVALGVDVADLYTFPWQGHPRHHCRELIRHCPTAELDGLIAVMERY